MIKINDAFPNLAQGSSRGKRRDRGVDLEDMETEILATANRMLERFDKDALRQVERRIKELRDQGEIDVAAFWADVQKALLGLRDGTSGADRK